MSETTLGVIGGTGLYALETLSDLSRIELETPFGAPSSPITMGRLGTLRLLFISRHGEGHVYMPSEINYRANIYALKKLGAQWCLSISAVGSLKEELSPGHVVVPDQFIDRTRGRQSTFFGGGICAHVAFATPICPVLQAEVFKTASKVAALRGAAVTNGGTYVCMEGPAFSTRAESHLYRSWGADIIGMTALPEAKLAREAELAYAILGLVTDYDCWRTQSADVNITEILEILQKNADLGKEVVRELAHVLPDIRPSELAANALQYAIVTAPDKISPDVRDTLGPIVERYIQH